MSEGENASSPPTDGSMFPMTFKLRKPVRNKDSDEVKELTLKEPTAGDIEACGNPVKIKFLNDGSVEFVYEEAKMSAMLSRLSGIPPVFFKSLDPRDWNTLAYRMSDFFIPDLGLQA